MQNKQRPQLHDAHTSAKFTREKCSRRNFHHSTTVYPTSSMSTGGCSLGLSPDCWTARTCIEEKERPIIFMYVSVFKSNVIHTLTYLERYFGADRRDEHTNLVSLVVNLVRTPAEMMVSIDRKGVNKVPGTRESVTACHATSCRVMPCYAMPQEHETNLAVGFAPTESHILHYPLSSTANTPSMGMRVIRKTFCPAKQNAQRQTKVILLLVCCGVGGCRPVWRLASRKKTRRNGRHDQISNDTMGKQADSSSTHFIRLEATFVTTSLPPSNRRGMRLAKRYTFTPSFTWSTQ